MFGKNKKISDIIEKCDEINSDIKSETACFTGHRSQKLPWGFNELDPRCVQMKDRVKSEIEKAISLGYKYFISGMALGFDMIVAEIILELKKVYSQIKLICAIPCKNQAKYWSFEQKIRYKKLLKSADIVRYISDDYSPNCMLERNAYMINNSSLIIALYDGTGGGTAYTLKLAKEKQLNIVIIKP